MGCGCDDTAKNLLNPDPLMNKVVRLKTGHEGIINLKRAAERLEYGLAIGDGTTIFFTKKEIAKIIA